MQSDLLPEDARPGARRPRASEGEASEAASLTADMIRRGRNPWWGKDQAPNDAVPKDDLPSRTATAPEAATPHGGAEALRQGLRRVRLDDPAERPSPFLRLDASLRRDLLIFLAVFSVSCAAMLYLSFHAL